MKAHVLGAAALLALAACTEPAADTQQTTGGFVLPGATLVEVPDFIGMSESRVRSCAGRPDSETVSVLEGPTRWMFYRIGLGDEMCKATFTIAGGRVVETRFTDFREQVLTDLSACSPIFADC